MSEQSDVPMTPFHPGVDEPVSQAEIDAIIDDPVLSPTEKQARLEELRERILNQEHAAHEEDYLPFEARIMDALSMLAEGGHDYGTAAPAKSDDDDEDRTR